MNAILEGLKYFLEPRFVLLCGAGSVAGLFVGAVPGLSVSMATALLVSITYSWEAPDALAAVMGVYVVGVFSGALSAILLNIPGAPSSVVTTLDGYPMAKRGEAYKALKYATVYSFVGSVFGLIALALTLLIYILLVIIYNHKKKKLRRTKRYRSLDEGRKKS